MASAYTSPWRPIYERYRTLESLSLDQATTTKSFEDRVLHLLVQSFRGGPGLFRSQLTTYQELATKRGWHQPHTLIDHLLKFVDRRCSYDSSATGFVFEDVYHYAFDALFSDWRSLGERPVPLEQGGWLYRGQRDATWQIQLSVLRNTHQSLRKRAENTCRIARAISTGLGKPFEDGVAIAQHYSGADLVGTRKLDVTTWFADFSNDPWVALFFASDKGKDGEFGIVWQMMKSEIDKVFAGVVGELRLVVPHDVPRIRHQSGIFVSTAHAAFFDQYVPFRGSNHFRQHAGLVFEDPLLGITTDWIYPPIDWVADRIFNLCDRVDACICDPTFCRIPAALFADPSDAGIYLDLMRAWGAAEGGGRVDSVPEESLVELAHFHAALHSSAYAGDFSTKGCRSLHHLRVALSRLMFVPDPAIPRASARDAAIHAYVDSSAFPDKDLDALMRVIDKLLPPPPHGGPIAPPPKV